jgi:catalase
MPLTTDEKLLALSREVIEMFDKANGGVHPGFRPAHAKGILLTGTLYAVLRGRVADAGAATWAR